MTKPLLTSCHTLKIVVYIATKKVFLKHTQKKRLRRIYFSEYIKLTLDEQFEYEKG